MIIYFFKTYKISTKKHSVLRLSFFLINKSWLYYSALVFILAQLFLNSLTYCIFIHLIKITTRYRQAKPAISGNVRSSIGHMYTKAVETSVQV